MHRSSWILILLTAPLAAGQEPREADFTKRQAVERPTEELVANLSTEAAAAPVQEARPAAADRTKSLVIEPAAEAIVRGTRPPDAEGAEPQRAEAGANDNPRVEPGKVRWHDDVAAAIAAAKASGKPVLVFHLLGQLDQRFT